MNRTRKFWLQFHLWLGLLFGAVFVLLGITGSLLVFRYEIDEFLQPELLLTAGDGPRKSLSEIVALAETAHQPDVPPSHLYLPRTEQGVFEVSFNEPLPDGGTRNVQIAVDPYTGAHLGQRAWGESITTWIYDLHYTLRLGQGGETAVGIFGALLVLSLATGLYLWWPEFRAKGRRALLYRRGASPARRNRDLHNVSGIYALLLLLVVSATGVYLVFSGFLRPALSQVASMTPRPEDLSSSHSERGVSIPADRALEIGRNVFPAARPMYVELPHGADGVYRINLRQPGEAYRSVGRSEVWVDQYTGEVLAARNPRAFTVADHLDEWMFPLHSGEGLGGLGRWLVFVSGFIPLVLYITGLRIWWRKRQGRRRRALNRTPRRHQLSHELSGS